MFIGLDAADLLKRIFSDIRKSTFFMTPSDILLTLLDQSYNHPSWHGTNLSGSLRGLKVPALSWRPGPKRHNIWEIAVHCAYWKYVVRRRMLGEKRGSFPLKGSNWFKRIGVEGPEVWKADLALLDDCHQQLRTVVRGLTERDLRRKSAKGKWTLLQMVEGIASHDLYHAGQIQLLKRIQRTGKS